MILKYELIIRVIVGGILGGIIGFDMYITYICENDFYKKGILC